MAVAEHTIEFLYNDAHDGFPFVVLRIDGKRGIAPYEQKWLRYGIVVVLASSFEDSAFFRSLTCILPADISDGRKTPMEIENAIMVPYVVDLVERLRFDVDRGFFEERVA